MELRDSLTLLSIIAGPVTAVCITLWWQRRKEKRDSKNQLFMTLMAHRLPLPPTIEWARALNMISVVFADQPKVVELWERYYESLSNPPANENYQQREHTRLLMLTAMARSLGYRRLEQTDIDKYYSPQAHGNQMALSYNTQTELLRVLQNTSRFERHRGWMENRMLLSRD